MVTEMSNDLSNNATLNELKNHLSEQRKQELSKLDRNKYDDHPDQIYHNNIEQSCANLYEEFGSNQVK